MWTVEQPHINGRVAEHGIEATFRELATLRAENKRLRAQLARRDRRSLTVERAILDAHSVLTEAFSAGMTSRKGMLSTHGMSRRRWAWAVAMLRYAGIVSKSKLNWQAGLDFLIDDLATAVQLLETSGRELSGAVDGYNRLLQLARL